VTNRARPARVSVVIPFLNAGRFIREALDSVVAQTFEDWEIRLVNDGSSDDSPAIARTYAERWPNQVFSHAHPDGTNRGTPASRNLGIREARGSLVAFLDADDVWLPHKLEQQVAVLEKYPDADAAYGRSQYWHSWTGAAADELRDETPDLGLEPELVFRPPALATINYPLGTGPAPPPSALLVRRQACERIGGFDETFTGPRLMYEDQTFLIKLYLTCGLVVGTECWERYRQHPESVSAQVTSAGEYGKAREAFLRWLEAYLAAQRIDRPEILRALRRAQRPGLHRFASLIGRGLRRPAGSPDRPWRQRVLSESDAEARLAVPGVAVQRARFDAGLDLHGAIAMRTVGGGLKLELIWRSPSSRALSAIVAIHLIDAAGDIRGQADYAQNQGLDGVKSGAVWRDVVLVPHAALTAVTTIGLGVCDPRGDLVAAHGLRTDMGGRRVLLDLPRA
jgi:hypothetical protein